MTIGLGFDKSQHILTSGRGKIVSIFLGKTVLGKFVLESNFTFSYFTSAFIDDWGHSLWWLRPSSLCSLPNHNSEQAISTKLGREFFLPCLCLDFRVLVIVVQCPALFCLQDLIFILIFKICCCPGFFMFVAKFEYAWDALKEVEIFSTIRVLMKWRGCVCSCVLLLCVCVCYCFIVLLCL